MSGTNRQGMSGLWFVRMIVLLTLIPCTVCSQNADSTQSKKVFIGVSFSPDYCYRTLKSDGSTTGEAITNYRDSLEIPKIGYTAGISLKMQLHRKWTLETGILFSDKGEKTRTYSPDWVPPSTDIDPSLPTEISFNYHYIYLDVPLKVNYFLLANRWKFYLSAGLSSNFFLVEKVSSWAAYSDGQSSTSNSFGNNGFSRFNLACTAGFGVGYAITQKMLVNMEPTYRRSLTSIINAPIKGYLYSVGINVGLSYQL